MGIAASSFETPAAPAPQDKENWPALTRAIGCFIHRADLDYCRVHYEMMLVLVQLFSFYKRYRYGTSAVAPLGLVFSLIAVMLFTGWKGEEWCFARRRYDEAQR